MLQELGEFTYSPSENQTEQKYPPEMQSLSLCSILDKNKYALLSYEKFVLQNDL